MGADALIDFDRRLLARYLGTSDFEIYLNSQLGDSEQVLMPGALLKQLLDDRHHLAGESLKLARGGRDGSSYLADEEQERMNSGILRDLWCVA